jgi:hypothetical protein
MKLDQRQCLRFRVSQTLPYKSFQELTLSLSDMGNHRSKKGSEWKNKLLHFNKIVLLLCQLTDHREVRAEVVIQIQPNSRRVEFCINSKGHSTRFADKLDLGLKRKDYLKSFE